MICLARFLVGFVLANDTNNRDLSDEYLRWRPCNYTEEVWGYPVFNFQFLTNKLLDYCGQEAQLLEIDNPFGAIVAAHLAGLETRSTKKSLSLSQPQAEFI